MRTFDQIKSDYRICQINDEFYIQGNSILGWSFDTRTDVGSADYPKLPIVAIILFLASIIVLFACVLTALLQKEYNNGITLSLISTLFFFSLHILYSFKSKRCSIKCGNLKYAEEWVNMLVNDKIKYLTEKELKKNKKIKYHYFYTDKQIRMEKLKKLK